MLVSFSEKKTGKMFTTEPEEQRKMALKMQKVNKPWIPAKTPRGKNLNKHVLLAALYALLPQRKRCFHRRIPRNIRGFPPFFFLELFALMSNMACFLKKEGPGPLGKADLKKTKAFPVLRVPLKRNAFL